MRVSRWASFAYDASQFRCTCMDSNLFGSVVLSYNSVIGCVCNFLLCVVVLSHNLLLVVCAISV